MKRALVLLGLIAACGPVSVPFAISMRLQRDETSEMCPTNSCDLVPLGCNAKVSLRIVDAEQQNIVYVSKCVLVDGGPDVNLCSIADIKDITEFEIPNTMVQIQVAVWPAPSGTNDGICPDAVFSEDGLVSTTDMSPAPALGGASYFEVGSSAVATVTLGCVNVPALDSPVCALPNGVDVTTNVLDETGLSVTSVTASNLLHVYVGEPSFDTGAGEFSLPTSDATLMSLPILGPIPLWKANVPGFDQSACIEVDNTQGAIPTTLTCAPVDPAATEMMIDGAVLLGTTPAALEAALGTLPPTGLVYGRVVDHTGTFAAGVTVTATQGTVLYLNDTLDSTNDGTGQPLTATTTSGAFLSLDAPYEVNGAPNQWTATDGSVVSEGTVIGGRVTGMVSIVQLHLADPGEHAVSEQWYRIALADDSGVRLVVAPGEHLGEAIAAAQARAGRGDAWPIAVEPAKAGEVPLGESVGKGVVVEREPPTGLPLFRWPSGVVPSLEGARELGAPAEGYLRTFHKEVHAIEAMIAGDRLIETFMQVVELLPAADNVEVKVTGHFDGEGKAEVWLTPRLADVRKVLRFLDDHDVDILGNGHVEAAVYLRKQKSTLRMTEHKTILWLTEDTGFADQFASWMRLRELPLMEKLPLVSSVDHYHWRPTKAKNRKRLVQHLHRLRMRKVDSWADAA